MPRADHIAWPYLPFFVYGTLRRGMALEDSIQWAAEETLPAHLDDFALYAIAAPYIGPPLHSPSRVTGELVHVRREDFRLVLDHLDGIEGYDPRWSTNYIRAALPVVVLDGNGRRIRLEPAWVYMGDSTRPYRRENLIPGGDYVAYRREEAERLAQLEQRAREETRA